MIGAFWHVIAFIQIYVKLLEYPTSVLQGREIRCPRFLGSILKYLHGVISQKRCHDNLQSITML
jgi:hypothetical protein